MFRSVLHRKQYFCIIPDPSGPHCQLGMCSKVYIQYLTCEHVFLNKKSISIMSKCYNTDMRSAHLNECCSNWACGSALWAFIQSICSPCAAVNIHLRSSIWGFIHAFKAMIAFMLKLQQDMGGFKIDSISFHLNLTHVINSVFYPGDSEASCSSVKWSNYTVEYHLKANWPYMWLWMYDDLTSHPTQTVDMKVSE